MKETVIKLSGQMKEIDLTKEKDLTNERELYEVLTQAIIDFDTEGIVADTSRELAFRYLTLAQIYLKNYLKELGERI